MGINIISTKIEFANEDINNLENCLKPIIRKCEETLIQKNQRYHFSFNGSGDIEGVDFLTNNEIDYKGKNFIYFFEAKFPGGFPSASTFCDAWNYGRDFKGFESFPKVDINNAQKVKRGTSLWVPLYLGKSESWLKTRLKAHIIGAAPKVGAMKLQKTPEFFKSWNFSLKIISIGNFKFGSSMLTLIEALLRDRMNPVIGAQ